MNTPPPNDRHTSSVQVIRIFVSSPGDVAEERRVLDEVVERINRTDGRALGVRLELWKWEDDMVPQIGPRPQDVVDAQTPADYDVYLGILRRFSQAELTPIFHGNSSRTDLPFSHGTRAIVCSKPASLRMGLCVRLAK